MERAKLGVFLRDRIRNEIRRRPKITDILNELPNWCGSGHGTFLLDQMTYGADKFWSGDCVPEDAAFEGPMTWRGRVELEEAYVQQWMSFLYLFSTWPVSIFNLYQVVWVTLRVLLFAEVANPTSAPAPRWILCASCLLAWPLSTCNPRQASWTL